MADVVIFGSGRIAEVGKAYLDRFSSHRVVAFTADAAYCRQESFHGLPLIPWERLEEVFPPGTVSLLGPLSYQRLNRFRRERHQEGKARGYDFASFIHPSVHNMADGIGENCFILENCTLQPFSRIGEGVMIWSGTHIGHHSQVGDFCFLSSLVGLAGGVSVGDGCMIGGQVGIDNGITIGRECYLESRAMIRQDLADGSVVRGPTDTPSRITSDRLINRRFV